MIIETEPFLNTYFLNCVHTLNKTTLLGAFSSSVMDGSSFAAVLYGGDAAATDAADGGGGSIDCDGGLGGSNISFSCIIRPPRFDVFSTCNAIDIPCSCLPKP